MLIKAALAVLLEPVDLLKGCGSGDPKPFGEFGYRVVVQLVVLEESLSLFAHGDTYPGQGGRDPSAGRQIADQTLSRGNLAIARSMREGHPVRVIRGAGHVSPISPTSGYRYDGLCRTEWELGPQPRARVQEYRGIFDARCTYLT